MAKGKLKNLFKKKEGGTFVGNLLRKAGDMATGGAYSSLFPKPTAADVAKQSGEVLAKPSTQSIGGMSTRGMEIDINASTGNESITKKSWFLPVVVAVPLAIIGLVVMIFRRRTPKKR